VHVDHAGHVPLRDVAGKRKTKQKTYCACRSRWSRPTSRCRRQKEKNGHVGHAGPVSLRDVAFAAAAATNTTITTTTATTANTTTATATTTNLQRK